MEIEMKLHQKIIWRPWKETRKKELKPYRKDLNETTGRVRKKHNENILSRTRPPTTRG